MKTKKAITLTEVKRKLKGVPKDRRGAIVCALIGHSKIVTGCFGYVHCARCDAQIADKIGGAGYANAPDCVEVRHNCHMCRENYRKMDWHDTFLTPDPFTKEKVS